MKLFLFFLFLKIHNILFLLILINSTVLTISVSSWLISWMALELNLMMLIPLLINKVNFSSVGSAIKYFLVQALASILIIISLSIFKSSNYMTSICTNNEIMLIAMMMKSGIPPFHFWLPQVLELVSYPQATLILTWQKIAPFVLITYNKSQMLVMFLMLAAIIGSLGGLNQNSLKKILAYSSMTHAAWMIACVLLSEKIWTIYFLFYSIILVSLTLVLNTLKMKKMSDMMKMNLSNSMKISFCMSIMSLGGLPPFLGFLGKIMIIKKIAMWSILGYMTTLLVSSFISLLYYMRISYMILLKGNISKKKEFKLEGGSSMNLYTSLFMNMITPTMVLLT